MWPTFLGIIYHVLNKPLILQWIFLSPVPYYRDNDRGDNDILVMMKITKAMMMMMMVTMKLVIMMMATIIMMMMVIMVTMIMM